MKRIIFIIFSFFLLFTGYEVYAQQKTRIIIAVYILDEYTRETIKEAIVSVYDKDSTFIDTMRVLPVVKGESVYRHILGVTPSEGYHFKIECDGYETKWATIPLKDIKSNKIPEIILQKSSILLDEINVIGSKILMVNKGDTIVYNASALQLANGSMLGELIKRLPGVELHSGGRITIYGKYVSSLLVNGRDFFKGDPKVALENLPAYYVDKIKVYHKLNDIRRVLLEDSLKAKENDPYVVDVRLKRDYEEGWLGNGEIAGGTNDKYMLRLFGMRYRKHSAVFAYSNENNLNNAQSVTDDGNWKGLTFDEGIIKTHNYGFNFYGNDQKTNMEYATSAKLNIQRGEHEKISSIDNYYPTSNIFQRDHFWGYNKCTNLNWRGMLNYPIKKRLYLDLELKLIYNKTDEHNLSRFANFLCDPEDSYLGESVDSLFVPKGNQRLIDILINQCEKHEDEKKDNTILEGRLMASMKLFRKILTITFNGNYENIHKNTCEYDYYKYGYKSEVSNNLQNRIRDNPIKNYIYEAKVSYGILERPFMMEINYGFCQSFSSDIRQIYKFDNNSFNNAFAYSLPSSSDSLQVILDIHNSYNTTTLIRKNNVGVHLQWKQFQIDIPITFENDYLKDYRSEHIGSLSRNKPVASLMLGYSKVKKKSRLFATYNYNTILPKILYLLDVRDDADPYNISLGNPELRNSYSHSFNMMYDLTQTKKTHKNVSFRFRLWMIEQAVGLSKRYDLSSGKNLFRPDNINGNWGTNVYLSYSQYIDMQRRVRLTANTNVKYQHSVDYATIHIKGNSIIDKNQNVVNNYVLSETLKADFHKKDWYVSGIIHADWNHATSPTESFTTINACEYNYGLTLTKQLVKNLTFETEAMMWSRRGYVDPMMNNNEFIMNALLSYALGKTGKWVIRAEGRDILNHRKPVHYIMNAQGRTETWYKTVPSYWMLHLIYQFKRIPKSKIK